MKKKQRVIPLAIILLGLTLLITIHELGHFIMCRIFGVRTPVFSIGFGPQLIGFNIGQTLFQLALLPLGGYVSINEQDIAAIPYYQKMIIVLAGVLFNVILSFLLLLWLLHTSRKRLIPVIDSIIPHSPAEQANLKEGDRIIRIDDIAIDDTAMNTLLKEVASHPGEERILTIERNNEHLEIPIRIGTRMAGQLGSLGVTFMTGTIEPSSFMQKIQEAATATYTMLKDTLIIFLNLFRKKEYRKKVAGPIGVITSSMETTNLGPRFYALLLSSVSIQLAFFNTLPIAFFDGSKAFFYTLEYLYGQPLSPYFVAAINFITLMLLLALMMYLSFRDIRILTRKRND